MQLGLPKKYETISAHAEPSQRARCKTWDNNYNNKKGHKRVRFTTTFRVLIDQN